MFHMFSQVRFGLCAQETSFGKFDIWLRLPVQYVLCMRNRYVRAISLHEYCTAVFYKEPLLL